MKNYINKPDILKWYIYKILLIMRLTTVILMVSMLQVSASTVAQEFNYVKKGASLIQIFKEIKKQTGYNIIWNEKKIDVTTTIDANFKEATIHDVLKKCLSNLPLSYSVNDKMVMIKEEESSFFDKVVNFFTAIDVRGRVVDENNAPLVGAVVKVKGSTISTPTDSNGEFLLRNVDENAILIISFLGYETQEVKASKNIEPIRLTPRTDKLEEVEINAGYYTVKDRERTGSISRITSKDIERQPVNNPLLALQNRVPGLEVTQLTGIPGGSVKVQIRGKNSIANGNSPLYIIDGLIYPEVNLNTANSNIILGGGLSPLSLINPNDIESIEVLKDADATAIYGSRGANGVIIITTKKGADRKVKVNGNISQAFSKVGSKIDLMNTEQYIAMRMEAFKNDNRSPGASDYDVNGVWDKNKYTDWQKELIGGTASTTNASLNISGGNENSNYLVGANYVNEGTVTRGSFNYNRSNIHSSLNFGAPTKRFHASFSSNFIMSKNTLPAFTPTGYLTMAPNAPDGFDENGNLNWNYNNVRIVLNPFADLLKTIRLTTQNFIGNAKLSFRVFDNLLISGSFGYNAIKGEELARNPNSSRNPATNPTPANRQTQFGNLDNNSWIAEPQITYKTPLGPGEFSALIGMSFQANLAEAKNILTSGYSNDELMENISSATTFSVRESVYKQYNYAAIFSRLNYSLADKYFLNLTARRDASSRFGPANQFANFGAIGAGWIFSEEKIFKEKFSFLNFGKLRASYGVTGNDQITDYSHIQLYTATSTYQGLPSSYVSKIANPNLGWEINKKSEVALQLGFLKGRLDIEVAYYENKSSNQLIGSQLPPSVGASSIQANLPAKVQNSGWEFIASANILTGKKMSWTMSMNLTAPKNKLLEYPNLSTSGFATSLIIGEPLNIIRLYNYTVDPQTGLYVVEDYDSNGVKNDADRYLNKFLGQVLYGGLQNTFRYRNLNLDFLVAFSKQEGKSLLSNTIYSPGYADVTFSQNQPRLLLDRWTSPNDESHFAKYSTTSSSLSNFNAVSDGIFSVEDASFIRLKSISLSYDLPTSLISRLNIDRLQLNFQGQNVFILTKYKGLNPESQSNSLPPLRTFLFGLKLTL